MFTLKATLIIIGVLLEKAAQGLECYACEPCKDEGLGIISICQVGQAYCAEGELEVEGGHRIGVRTCAYTESAESDDYVCEKFKTFLPNPKQKLRLCYCHTDLCNYNTLFSSAFSSRHSQLLLFLLPLNLLFVY